MPNIAIQGCCHGELNNIYETIRNIPRRIDLLIICGDFQSIRNEFDLDQMAVPLKFKRIGDFEEYYAGRRKVPVKTLFIGGNHEASNYLWELYHGGYVAQDIYFMGHCGVVDFGGLRIGGLSGIFNAKHYNSGYFEKQPLDSNDCRSIYHVRKYCIWKMSFISKPIDIMISHDWPQGIAMHGDTQELLSKKRFLAQEVKSNSLGSSPALYLMKHLKPTYWFSAHLHVKFAAIYKHQETNQETKFLALDKCLPGRDFLQVLEIPVKEPTENIFKLDPEWLAIVKTLNKYAPIRKEPHFPPKETIIEQLNANIKWVKGKINEDSSFLHLPTFQMTAASYKKGELDCRIFSNPQTVDFCSRLEIDNFVNSEIANPEEIFID